MVDGKYAGENIILYYLRQILQAKWLNMPSKADTSNAFEELNQTVLESFI
jgi:hypothetical protein